MFYELIAVKNSHLSRVLTCVDEENGLYRLRRLTVDTEGPHLSPTGSERWENNIPRYTRTSFRAKDVRYSIFLFGIKDGYGRIPFVFDTNAVPILIRASTPARHELETFKLFSEAFLDEVFGPEGLICEDYIQNSRMIGPSVCEDSRTLRDMLLV